MHSLLAPHSLVTYEEQLEAVGYEHGCTLYLEPHNESSKILSAGDPAVLKVALFMYESLAPYYNVVLHNVDWEQCYHLT